MNHGSKKGMQRGGEEEKSLEGTMESDDGDEV